MGLPKSSVLRVESLEDRRVLSGDVVLRWNEILLQTLATHTGRIPLARNLALVHVAIFDAVNAIDRSYEPYHARVPASRGASKEAAAAQAARDTLVALYPARQPIFDAALGEDLAGIPDGRARQGIAVGQEVARQILTLRSNDGSSALVTYTPPNNDPGQWHPTLPDRSPAGGAHVSAITPFAITSSSRFRPGPPPALSSPQYAAAFNEAKALGRATGSARTADQTQVAMLWRVPLTNHQVWNRVAQDMAEQRDTSLAETARLFALLNMALNDGLQTSFASKYHYALWRPIEAIHRAAEDGNPETEADPNWATLHPTTPPYPTYAGNAATIGAACSTVLAEVFGGRNIPFQVRWDAYGFPGVTRSYPGFWAAADEMARSRVYGGIHFTFDSVAGQGIGFDVADYVVDNYLLPKPATIESVVIGDGSAQRSMVNSLTIAFDRVVTPGAGAFGLSRHGGGAVSLSVASSLVEGRTVAVLTFTGPDILGGSLADGGYTLTIRGDHIRDGEGQELDGDGDGAAGGDRGDAFFRLYGDGDGDGDVDLSDFGQLLGTLGRRQGDPLFLAYLDYDGDGQVGARDLWAFARRFGTRLSP